MANDRLFIKCDVCGCEYMLAKFWGGHFDVCVEERKPGVEKWKGLKFYHDYRMGLDQWLWKHYAECQNDNMRFSVVNVDRSTGPWC